MPATGDRLWSWMAMVQTGNTRRFREAKIYHGEEWWGKGSWGSFWVVWLDGWEDGQHSEQEEDREHRFRHVEPEAPRPPSSVGFLFPERPPFPSFWPGKLRLIHGSPAQVSPSLSFPSPGGVHHCFSHITSLCRTNSSITRNCNTLTLQACALD